MEKFKKLIAAIIMIATLGITATSAACTKKDGKLKIGFAPCIGEIESVLFGIRSDHTDFDVNEVTLDFYFGGDKISESSNLIGMAVYFCNYTSCWEFIHSGDFDDYTDVAGMHFIRLISIEDYNSDEYRYRLNIFKEPIFTHCETLTVPAEMFTKDEIFLEDRFGIVICSIYKGKDSSFYRGYIKGSEAVRFEFLNDRTVRLSNGTVFY